MKRLKANIPRFIVISHLEFSGSRETLLANDKVVGSDKNEINVCYWPTINKRGVC